jgi:hypothetical protein
MLDSECLLESECLLKEQDVVVYITSQLPQLLRWTTCGFLVPGFDLFNKEVTSKYSENQPCDQSSNHHHSP